MPRPAIRLRAVPFCAVLIAALAAAAPARAHGDAPVLEIGDAWMRAPVGAAKNAAAYMTLFNIGDADARLVGAASPAAETVTLHRSTTVDGVSKMRPVEAVPVPAAGHAELAPGGLHLMLKGVTDAAAGDSVPVTLDFAAAGETTVEVTVVPPGTTPDAVADRVLVQMRRATADGPGARVGTVALGDHAHGLLAMPLLQGLSAGPHAMHVHDAGSCQPAEKDGETVPAAAAGGHYDPEGTGRYAGPYADGARGDMPNIVVEANGTATIPVLAPRLALDEVRGRSLMIHRGADRHGGGGSGGMRMYCGVIPE